MNRIVFTFRKLQQNKTANLLGLAGLTVGLVCVIYIFLWVTDEISYNRFHSNIDRIFVVHAFLDEGTGKVDFRGCPPAVGPALMNEYPEVKNTCRYIPAFYQQLLAAGEQKFMENIAYSEFSLFDIFSIPFVYGSKGEEGDPNKIILTEVAAKRYFGNANPVGNIVRIENRQDMTVVGVVKNMPHNSSLTFDALIPLENIGGSYSRDDFLTSWYNNSFATYGLLKTPEGFDKIASTITRRIQKEIPESTNYLRAYRFKDEYLYEQKHAQNVKIFILIALMVLVAATLNFVNLSTARSSKQAKETGLRKAIGASRMNIARLIYSEIASICITAFVAAILASILGWPLFNHIIGKEIEFSALFSGINISVLFAVFILTVILAGSYPAFFLSSFMPGQTLSQNYQTIKKRGLFRNTLVVTMFVISIVMLSSTIIISSQTSFLQKLDPGFKKDQLMYISLNGKLREQINTLKEEIGRSSGVLSSSAVSYLPVLIGNNSEDWDWEGKSPDFKPLVTEWNTDEDLVLTLGAEMAEGEFFKKSQAGVVINRSFANMIGWTDPIGKTITGNGRPVTILGVINDIRYNSLSEETKPMVIEKPEWSFANYLVVKVNAENISGTLDFISKACKKIEPAFPVSYSFLDSEYDQLLKSEINLEKLVNVFSAFAIIVLFLGLLGLVIFLTEQKTKEIGIRKCMGEKVLELIVRFIKPFLISGIIAGIIAIPLTWFAMEKWLGNYAEHIQLNPWMFIFSCAIVIGIVVLTVVWQSWNAATKNPVEALRYE